MRVQFLTPKMTPSLSNSEKSHYSNTVMPSNLSALKADTVSFTGVGSKFTKRATSTISEYVERGVESNMERMRRIATTYLDVLESIANSLSKDGFSFDRAYCELSPVKSPKSYVSKITRSGSMKVPDSIRATLYCNNPYDLTNISKKLLPEMKKRGYVLAKTDMSIEELMSRGYVPKGDNISLKKKVQVPDLDIRLEDVSANVNQLQPELRYSIGKPQKSGYEDIQMRFVRVTDKADNPVSHELIILFGPNYAKAKHTESERVYSFLRKFDELNMKFTDKTVGSHSQKANRYIDLIKQMFRGKVSEKLFLNAKNKDLYDISDAVPIHFADEDIKLFETYFSGLRDRMNSCYSEARKAAAGKSEQLKELAVNKRLDSLNLTKIFENLKETINFFNSGETAVSAAKKAKKS